MEIRAVRIGNRYGPEYEDYLKSKLPEIKFLNEQQNNLWLQWNKLNFFALDYNEPICVIDIDILLINDYIEIFNYPIERGEFLTVKQWWDPEAATELNGVFYKFYPSDTKYIFDKLIESPRYWMEYFIKNKIKPGPINGEENFVEMMAKKRLKIKYLPETWCCRMSNNKEFKAKINALSPLPYVHLDKYHPDIKLVHFSDVNNHIDHSSQL